MANKAKLPIGIENFEKLRKEDFYYVDKTNLIKELLDNWSEVNLFTRPRRFGKSLNMDMLKCFFECGCDAGLFENLNISREKEYCEKYMGSFPVVSVSLKGVSGTDYAMALGMLRFAIGNEALRFQFLSESPRLSDRERAQYRQLINVDTSGRHGFLMTEEVLANSLYTLCACLHKHYGRKTILLIDEYDVPLDKAQQAGYYDDMVSLIRNMFGQALKTNASLHMAVLTGCLRITKESIFTGLNNMNIFSVTDPRFSQWFGFTAGEIREMLDYYGFADKSEDIREWYDGYRFGSTDIYCPWDVINYVSLLLADPLARPQAFWINTSGNDIIRRFISMAAGSTRREIERLVDGESVAKPINQNLTYRDLYKNIGNLWSVLFATGYLTQRGEREDGALQLAIPNREIRQIFAEQILDWFQEEARRDTPRLDAFCGSFLPQRGRPYSRGAVRGLSGQNHQRPGCRGQEGTEGELLPRSSSGPAESPGGLGPQFQRRGRGGLQRHSGRGRGWNHGHCDRGQIRRGRGSGESLSGGAGADRSEGVRGGAAPKRRGEHPQIRHSLL